MQCLFAEKLLSNTEFFAYITWGFTHQANFLPHLNRLYSPSAT